MILVLVNLGEAAPADYSLTLEASSLLQGNHQLVRLMGGEAASGLTVDARGGFSGLAPVRPLAGHSIRIFQIKSQQ